MFRELAPHLPHLELAGEATRLGDLHVGAIASLPVRWSTEALTRAGATGPNTG